MLENLSTLENEFEPIFLSTALDTFPDIILAEPDYKLSEIIKEFLISRNVGRTIETFRDGIDTLDYLKILEFNNYKPKAILLNLVIPYNEDVLIGISEDPELKKIPLIIFSDYSKNTIISKYNLNENSYVLKPMQLLRCEEIIKSFKVYNIPKEPLFPGRKFCSKKPPFYFLNFAS